MFNEGKEIWNRSKDEYGSVLSANLPYSDKIRQGINTKFIEYPLLVGTYSGFFQVRFPSNLRQWHSSYQ